MMIFGPSWWEQIRWAVNGAVVDRDRPERRGRQPHRAGGGGDRAARSLSCGWAGCRDRPGAAGENPSAAAREASSGAAIVVAGGGDGTVSSVAAGIIDSPAALGVLPLGTLNHFAKDLQIPLDLREAVAVIAAGTSRRSTSAR